MSDDWWETWTFRLVKNLLGYATVAFPCAAFVYYSKKRKYPYSGDNCCSKCLKLFVYGEDDTKPVDSSANHASPRRTPQSSLVKALQIMACFAGLQIAYVFWGILQEKIMTREYYNTLGQSGKFSDSQFLVFVNRVLAFVIAASYVMMCPGQPKHVAPLYKYSYCSFTNIISSWLQYEALKYVSFPTQVLSKASKIIPVMIMGKIVSKKTYSLHEYLLAFVMSIGTAIFLFAGKESKDIATTSTVSGLFILLAYIVSDSFTSNWQSALFKQYQMSSMQMMCGVNFFSFLLTLISLLQQGAFFPSVAFLLHFRVFMWDCLVLSVLSAVGQLFIFYTISEFGPVVFVIMMTIRQVLSILLSCIIYDHDLTALRMFGVLIVFSTIFLRIYLNNRTKPAIVVETDQKV